MRKFSLLVVFAAAFALMSGMYGCAGGPEAKSVAVETPEWVNKGSGAYGGERGRVFYGVAAASGIGNAGLLRSTADNRARNEVAKTFQVYTASLMNDYAASTTSGKVGESSEEQHVEQAIKTITSATLNGVEIADHWRDPATGALDELARMDMDAFKEAAAKSKELSGQVKDYIKGNAEKMHEKMEQEIGKHAQK